MALPPGLILPAKGYEYPRRKHYYPYSQKWWLVPVGVDFVQESVLQIRNHITGSVKFGSFQILNNHEMQSTEVH